MKLLMSVLREVKERMLFVGGFRDNEIGGDHALSVFFNTVSASSDVTSSSIFLDGISAEAVNSMISDGLGLFPRLCKELSQVVHRKTKGYVFCWSHFFAPVQPNILQSSFHVAIRSLYLNFSDH
jgi:predicted ATPase